MTTIADLEIHSQNNTGKTFYKPVTKQAKGVSQFRDTEYFFGDLEGYWEIGNNALPTVGEWYTLALSTKPKTGPNSKPGAVYTDIAKIIPAKPYDIPVSRSQGPVSEGPTANGGDRNPWDAKFRTQEELRWTEALHMASRRAAVDPTIDETVVAEWYYGRLEVGPPVPTGLLGSAANVEPPEYDPSTDEELPF